MSETNEPDPQPVDPPLGNASLEGGRRYTGPPEVGPGEKRSFADGDLGLGASEKEGAPIQAEHSKSLGTEGCVDTNSERQSEASASLAEPVRRRRVRLPVILFIATCLSTFWAGANHWLPIPVAGTVRQVLVTHWQDGLIYMGCVLAILLAHEMGHFIATLRYGIPASLPFFIPFPVSPIGTMGAVIGMDGLRADRKELFDIGLAGPLAGLLLAVPIMWIGIAKLDLAQFGYGPFALDLPLITRIGLHYIQPPGYEADKLIWFNQLNPYFMAGWVGFLITGLNMLPVSQLDGGHVTYTLFGKKAHWVARGLVLFAAILVLVFGQWRWSPMILLVLFIGPDHPPTRDDNVSLGRVRTVIGYCAILIPIFCFAPRLIIVPN